MIAFWFRPLTFENTHDPAPGFDNPPIVINRHFSNDWKRSAENFQCLENIRALVPPDLF